VVFRADQQLTFSPPVRSFFFEVLEYFAKWDERRQTNELTLMKAAIRNRVVTGRTGRILPVTKLGIVWANRLLQFPQSVIGDVYNGAPRRRSYFWLDFRRSCSIRAGILDPASIVESRSRDSGQRRRHGQPRRNFLVLLRRDEDAKSKRIVMVAEDLIPTLQN
jgi:hypothetical protein